MTQKIDLAKLEKDWKARGFSFGVWIDPPGQTWEDFEHEADELFMLLHGQIELEIHDRVFHPEIGQEVFIPAGIFHSVRNIGKKEAEYAYGYNTKPSGA